MSRRNRKDTSEEGYIRIGKQQLPDYMQDIITEIEKENRKQKIVSILVWLTIITMLFVIGIGSTVLVAVIFKLVFGI